MSYEGLIFQYYEADIKSVKPLGDITLKQFVNSVIGPKPQLLDAFGQIATAAKAGNIKLKDELKKKLLFSVTPSVVVDGIRNYESIRKFNPFAVLEYDGITYADVLRDYIFEKMPSCIFAFLSPSKTGAKFIFHIETPDSVESYKEYYYGIAHHLDKFVKLDMSNRNSVLPLFVSFDHDARYREDAVPSNLRGYKEGSYVPYVGVFEPPEDICEEDITEIMSMVSFLINRIVDNGHPQLVAASFLSGGLSGTYGSTDEIYEHLISLIESNAYLSKNLSGYKLTARTMFQKGLLAPALLRRHQ